MNDDVVRGHASWALRLTGAVLACAFAGTSPAARADVTTVVEAAGGPVVRLAALPVDFEGEVTLIGDPRIVVTRLPAPAAPAAGASSAPQAAAPGGAGSMLLSFGVLIAWIASRRR